MSESNSLAVTNGNGGGPRTSAIIEWDEGFQNLVKKTVLKPSKREAYPQELALLAEQAVRTGLDPMSRQIYGIYRWDKRAADETMTIQVGIDGLRTIAERTGKYLGQSGPFWWDGQDWTDVWLSATPPEAAKVIVRKAVAGQVSETPAVAHRSEYMPLDRSGNPSGLWQDKPALMLAKCAESLALRKAFPADMAGLYTDDEMARADGPTPVASHGVEPITVPAGVDPHTGEIADAQAVELIGDEQAATVLEAVNTLAAAGVKCGIGLQAHGAMVDTESIENTIRSVPADRAGELIAWLTQKLDGLPVEAEVVA